MANDELRIYLVVRTDLDMPKGKLAVQSMHGALGLFKECITKEQQLMTRYMVSRFEYKVSLKAKNLAALMRAQRECKDAGIPTFTVEDAGFTVFEEPTTTAVAVGPVKKSDLPKYVQRLQLL